MLKRRKTYKGINLPPLPDGWAWGHDGRPFIGITKVEGNDGSDGNYWYLWWYEDIQGPERYRDSVFKQLPGELEQVLFIDVSDPKEAIELMYQTFLHGMT